MTAREQLKNLVDDYSVDNLKSFFRSKSPAYRPMNKSVGFTRQKFEDRFADAQQVGEIHYETERDNLAIFSIESTFDLNERTGRRDQYEFACKQLNQSNKYDAGVFVFHDKSGSFRFSLVSATYEGTSQSFNNYRRSTYFIGPDTPTRTFLKRIGEHDFDSLQAVKEAFSIQAVTKSFYEEFEGKFNTVSDQVAETNDDINHATAEDFVLLFVIRIIFLGFIQKRGWIGDNESFIQDFLQSYQRSGEGNNFYENWLETLFFSALNSPPGADIDFSHDKDLQEALSQAPYLNGGLFRKRDIDQSGITMPDTAVSEMLEFIFSFNFTLRESDPDDEEIALNPEFLGIIFERLVNKDKGKKDQGAVYTPRTEVDLMCRLSLVKWLNKNTSDGIKLDNLYELLFPERGDVRDQKHGSFSEREIEEMLERVEEVTVCDPAAGSGAFLVGMLKVIDDLEERLYKQLGQDDLSKQKRHQRKRRIIARSLYGVEVKEWAVWIAQLRLWITLFIDAPEDMQNKKEPILPSLDFKVQQGDSLVQRVGNTLFPVRGHGNIDGEIRPMINNLQELKTDFFNNDTNATKERVDKKELKIFRKIIEKKISDKKDKLNEYKNAEEQQLFETDEPEQKEMNLRDEEIERLEREIEELKTQKASLEDSAPLVWNIEFAEVFADGGFDVVVGNPPYVRQENIEDPQGKIDDEKRYKNLLPKVAKKDFPEYFSDQSIYSRSDLYTYFYIRSLKLLNEKGILTFVCSNSWLDVKYGTWLQRFLLKRVPTDFIIDNHAKRSFAEADVNTVITTMHPPQKSDISLDSEIRFVAFKKPFEDIAFSQTLIDVEKVREKEIDKTARTIVKSTSDLIEVGSNKSGEYNGEKWGGKFLRAPDVFFTIIEKGKEKLAQLGDVANIKFGLKTGNNSFFYLTQSEIEEWQIEDRFLEPVFKSPRESKSILVESSDLKYQAFICNRTKEELEGTNALKYIEHGEHEGVNEGSSVSSRSPWWSLTPEKGNTFWGKEIRKTILTYVSKKELIADCRLYYASVSSATQFYCNSTLFALFGETLKRDIGGGGGPRSLMVYEVEELPVLEMDEQEFAGLDKGFLEREQKTIFKECGVDPESDIPISDQEPDPMEDRKRLDDIIFDELGLNEEERKDVYRAVCKLVHDRISKADSV